MSIRSLLEPSNKSWLNIKANTIDPITLDVNSGDTIKFPVGSSIVLNGSGGTVDEIIGNVSGNIAWVPTSDMGEEYQTQTDNTLYNTTSTSYILIPNSTVTTPALPLGNYLIYYIATIQQVAIENTQIKTTDLDTLEDLSFWTLPYQANLTGNQVLPGFIVKPNISGVKRWAFYIKSQTGAQVQSIQTKWILFRLS